MAGFLPYLWHQRRFKMGRLSAGTEPACPPVDAAYLVRSLVGGGVMVNSPVEA